MPPTTPSGRAANSIARPEGHRGVVADVSSRIERHLGIGVINGLLLGIVLGGLATVWKGNPYLGLVVGEAIALNTLVAACLGGIVPLALKRLDLDPAGATAPVLMTFNDMCGFFFALGLANMLLHRLTL